MPLMNRQRRQFLLAAGGMTVSAIWPHAAAADGDVVPSDRPQPVGLPRTSHSLFQVRLELEVEGNVNVAKNPLVTRRTDLKLPVTSTATLEYEERYRRPGGADGTDFVTLSERFYHQAESTSTVNRRTQTSSLRPEVQSTIVRRELLPEVIYAVDDYLHRDELELLRTPVCSAAVDELLPRQEITTGDQYPLTADQMMSVLNLSSAQSSDITAKVVSVSDTEVRIQFRGDVQGSVEGVPTIVRCAGKLTYDRQQQTCTWLAMAIHETRDIGKAVPGFDVSGTVKMIRRPLEQPSGLPAELPPLDLTGPIPQDRLYVGVASETIGIEALLDRRWRMMRDVPGGAMMRMIDDEISIAQCDFRPLAALEPGRQWTLEALQAEVKKSLGKQLSAITSADQKLSESGLRVLRVTAQGVAESVPIEWIVLHFSDDSGRRLLATFTMETEHVTTFAGADDQLISTLRLVPPNQSPRSIVETTDPEPATAAAPPAAPSASDRR